MEIVIYKSKKVLELWDKGSLVKSYSIGIGKEEVGHKQRVGDMRTPEGSYKVCVKNPKSKYYLSFGLNYPNNEDAKQGLQKGLIDSKQYQAICAANEGNQCPPWDTELGGEIYVHGELEKQSWSQGCIRLNNSDIKELFDLTHVGMPVTIKA